jgi:hypothetical protein
MGKDNFIEEFYDYNHPISQKNEDIIPIQK